VLPLNSFVECSLWLVATWCLCWSCAVSYAGQWWISYSIDRSHGSRRRVIVSAQTYYVWHWWVTKSL